MLNKGIDDVMQTTSDFVTQQGDEITGSVYAAIDHAKSPQPKPSQNVIRTISGNVDDLGDARKIVYTAVEGADDTLVYAALD